MSASSSPARVIAGDLLRRLADHVVGHMAGHLDEGAVDAQDPLVGVEDDDALLRLERGGGDAKLFLDLAALRDVAGDPDHADRLAGLVAQRRLEHLEPDGPAAGARASQFLRLDLAGLDRPEVAGAMPVGEFGWEDFVVGLADRPVLDEAEQRVRTAGCNAT